MLGSALSSAAAIITPRTSRTTEVRMSMSAICEWYGERGPPLQAGPQKEHRAAYAGARPNLSNKKL